jgi:glycosyltransferase involved in cell wall biosynthesis
VIGYLGSMGKRSGVLKLHPVKDLALIDEGRSLWQVTGPDPQFLLQSRRFPLPPGHYRFVAQQGTDLTLLNEASVYVDFGEGFQESTRYPIHFVQHASLGIFTEFFFDRPAAALRFDPASGSRPMFGLERLLFNRADDPNAVTGFGAMLQGKQQRPNVLLNLFRLLPAEAGAGGAGRVSMALLTYLPEFVALRVIISSHHKDLPREFPGIDFVITIGDSYSILAEHLEWCHCYFDPLNALRPIYIPPDIPVLGWIHDLQHMHFPSFFSDAELEFRFREYSYVVHRADRLVAISQFERANFEKFYGAKHVDVIYESGFLAEAILDSGEVRQKKASDPYLIYPAIPWVHKNHDALLQALAVLHRRGVDIPIVMTNVQGQKEAPKRLADSAKLLGIDHLIKLEGFLPEADLAQRLLESRGLVFPSLYEGFGIPLVDALKLGVPILTSRCAAIPEICGDACSYFTNSRNALAVADDLEAFWNDDRRRERQRKAGLSRGARFSSRKMAAEISESIKTLVSKSATGFSNRAHFTFVPPLRKRISVFVVCDAVDVDGFFEETDFDEYYAKVFGPNASITLGIELRLGADKRISALLRSAVNLVVFDGRSVAGRDAAVYDFSTRFDDASYHLIVKYPLSFRNYTPTRVANLLAALDLYPDVECGILDPEVGDIVLTPRPLESEGCMRYETMRQEGFTVYDRVFRNGGELRGVANGTAQFLSAVATRVEVLRFPLRSP